MSDFYAAVSVASLSVGPCVASHTLVVVDDVSKMVATAVVGLSHAHTVVSEVDIAIIAWFRISIRSIVVWLWPGEPTEE